MPETSRKLLAAGAVAAIAIMGILGLWLGVALRPAEAPPAPEPAAIEPESQGATPRLADLQADWSDTENPHAAKFGTWSYTQNHKPLTAVGNWEALANQGIRGWGPEVSTAEDYLFICRASPESSLEALGTSAVGDVLMHTASAGRGNGVVMWTSPWTGNVTVSGAVWPTRSLQRANTWRLQLVTQGGAKTLDTGELPEDGTITRSKPSVFKVPALAIQEGDVLELTVMRSATTTPWGDFAGMKLTIAQEAPPAGLRAAAAPGPGTGARQTVAEGGRLIIVLLLVVTALVGLVALALAVIVILLLKRLREGAAGGSAGKA